MEFGLSRYNLPYRARALNAVDLPYSIVSTHYIAGTCSLNDSNEIHILEHHENTRNVKSLNIYKHAEEIRALAALPFPENHAKLRIFAAYRSPYTYHHEEKVHICTTEAESQEFSDVKEVDTAPFNRIHKIALSSRENDPLFAVFDSEGLYIYDITNTSSSIASLSHTEDTQTSECTSGCFDAHHSRLAITGGGSAIKCWDFRTSSICHSSRSVHSLADIKDVDCNPNVPYQLCTALSDGSIMLWDMRSMSKRPIVVHPGLHTHWITAAKYNPFHDELYVTAGTDATVKLWIAGLRDSQSTDSTKDNLSLSRTYDQHEDTVTAIAWSASDAWSFATLSDDGKICFNDVPVEDKYRILL